MAMTSIRTKTMDSCSRSSSQHVQSSSSSSIETTEAKVDVLFEIFLRLPVNSIFKFRCVSKQWLSLLSNPYFITKWMIRINTSLPSSSPWTLLFRIFPPKDQLSEDDDDDDDDDDTNIPKFSTASPDNIYSKFIPNHDGFSIRFLKDAEFVLGSSNGLVLLCSGTESHIVNYYVCNPLTRTWVSFPSPGNHSIFDLHGFICECSSPTSYTVVRVPKRKSKSSTKFDVEIFSSDLGEWNTYQVSCPQQVEWDDCWSDNVTHNGVLYWFESQTDRIIAYHFNNNETHCRLIDLPKKIVDGCDGICRWLGESEGLLCYGQITRHCDVERRKMSLISIWVLKEDCSNGGWVWDLVHSNIELKGVKLSLFGINPVDRNVLILCYKTNIFAYNIQTKTSEVLCVPPYFKANLRSIHFVVDTFVVLPRPTTLPLGSSSDAGKTD